MSGRSALEAGRKVMHGMVCKLIGDLEKQYSQANISLNSEATCPGLAICICSNKHHLLQNWAIIYLSTRISNV